MKAMILAAGRGERMLPLTADTPKPLLKVGQKALIEYHLERLAVAGCKQVIINIAYLGEQIRQYLGDGRAYGLQIDYSPESEPLETGGALLQALPLLGDQTFLLINGDVWTDYPFERLLHHKLNGKGHLVLVKNPEQNPEGDFSVCDSHLQLKAGRSYTFSGISLIHPELIATYPEARQKFPLVEVFYRAIEHRQLTTEIYEGEWQDIGTVQRLEAIRHSQSR